MPIKTLSIMIFTISFSFLNLKKATADDNDETPFPCSLNEGEFLTYSGNRIGYYKKNRRGYINPVNPDEKKNPDVPADKHGLNMFHAKICPLKKGKTVKILKTFSPEPGWLSKSLNFLNVFSSEQQPEPEQFFVAIEVIHSNFDGCQLRKDITYVLEILSCEEENKISVSTVNEDDSEEEQQTGFLVRK